MINRNLPFKSSLLNQIRSDVDSCVQNNKKDSSKTLSEPVSGCALAGNAYCTPDIFVKIERNKKTVGRIAGGLALLLAFVKRKSISKYVKKLFNKSADSATNVVKKQAQKIELPKPQFTCGVENPEQFAKEKKQYIEAIWKEYIHVSPPHVQMNPEKNILGLKALQKYGTVEDLRKLPRDYKLTENSEIMKEYAKFVGKVGELKDYVKLVANTSRENVSLYTEEALEEITKALRELFVNRAPAGKLKNHSYDSYLDYERLSKHSNKTISECANDIMRRIEQDNPWIFE